MSGTEYLQAQQRRGLQQISGVYVASLTASGAAQARWQCRIRLNDWRINDLAGLRDSP